MKIKEEEILRILRKLENRRCRSVLAIPGDLTFKEFMTLIKFQKRN